MSFARLLRADWVAMAAALALLLVMALDWYSTPSGQEARRIEAISDPSGGAGGQVERELQEDARLIAEAQERNAWQVPGAFDRLILLGLLATIALAIAAAYLRAAARRFEPPLTPSALAAVVAAVTAVAVAYRTLQEPGLDVATTVEAGAPLALIALGVLALAARSAMGAENDGTAWAEPGTEAEPAAEAEPRLAE
jgi:drug/metabolite transporter (DMT)-like permease